MEKVSELIIKGKLRLHQLADIDLEEIILPFITHKIKKYGKTMNICQDVLIFWGEIIAITPK